MKIKRIGMKQEILSKMKILKEVNEMSYFVPDGNDYRGICDELIKMVDEALNLKLINRQDYEELCEEFNNILKHVMAVREKAVKKYQSESQSN